MLPERPALERLCFVFSDRNRMDAGQLSQFILRDSDLLSAVFDFFSYGHSYRPPCIEMATLYHV